MASAVIGALRVNLGLNSAAFTDGLTKSQSKLRNFGKAAGKGLAVAGAAAAAAAGGVALAVRGALNAADDMSKVSQKIGIPIDELSRLKHAADLSGVSFGSLQNGMKRLSANMFDAQKGVGEGAEAFKNLGVSVTGADGSLRSSSDIMADVSARFKEMPDGAEKTALAMRIFGKAGADMIPMLNGGRDALRSMMDEADALGIVFDEKTGKSAEQFNDNISRINAAVSGLTVQLTASLAPTLEAISEKIIGWVRAFQGLSPETQKFIGIAGGLTIGLAALAIPLAAVAVSVGIIGAPVIAASVAIAGLTAAVIAFWPEIKAAGSAISEFAQNLPELFTAAVSKMAQVGRDLIAGLWVGIQERWDGLKSKVSGLADGVVNQFKSVFRIQSPSRVMMEIGKFIMQGLGIGMDDEKSDIESKVGGIGQSISGTFEGIGSSIAGAIKGVKSWKDVAVDALKSVAQTLAQSALSNISFGGGVFGGLAKGLLGGLFGGFRANGGPVSSSKSYVVGERGPELFTPGRSGGITSNANMMAQSANNNAANQNVSIAINFEGDGIRAIARNAAGEVVGQGLSAYDKQLDKTMVGKMQKAQTRQL